MKTILAILALVLAVYVVNGEQKLLSKKYLSGLSANMRFAGVTNGDARGQGWGRGNAPAALKASPTFEAAEMGSLAKRIVSEVVDEVVDIVDSIVFADSFEERMENAIEASYRHRGLISAAIAYPLLKNALGKQHFEKKGLDLIKQERIKEAGKWGTRL